jgi:hypothetical protein
LEAVATDVRLVFANAMAYNPDTNLVHHYAKELLHHFEERLQRLLLPPPKVACAPCAVSEGGSQ